MDLIAEAGPEYLRAVVEKLPSIRIVVLAGPEYQEELLFLTLKSGARGWIFKGNTDETAARLFAFLSNDYFLKPFVAQLILEEFKQITTGESLLPMEDEILRQCARGLAPEEVQENLKLSGKLLKSHWENIWQKLNINASAQAEVYEHRQPRSSMVQPV